MFLTYGLNEQGEFVSIDEVDKGKSHLQCPFCKVALIAKNGDVREESVPVNVSDILIVDIDDDEFKFRKEKYGVQPGKKRKLDIEFDVLLQ